MTNTFRKRIEWDHYWSFACQGFSTIRLSKFFDEVRLLCWGCIGHWGCRGSKALKITSKDFRGIQVVAFSFILMFWKTLFIVKSWNIIYQFLNLFCWRLLRPAYDTFLKIGSKDQNFHTSGFQNYLQISSNLYISYCHSPIKKNTLPSDTL